MTKENEFPPNQNRKKNPMKVKKIYPKKKKRQKRNSRNHARLKTVIISIGSDYDYICVCAFNIF